MKRENVFDDREHDLITGLIVSTKVCEAIVPILDISLLKAPYAQLVAGWVKDHFNKYHKAPWRDIRRIYRKRQPALDEDTNEAIQAYLSNLSREYLQRRKKEAKDFDPIVVIDDCLEYLNKQKALQMIKQAKRMVSGDKIQEGWELLELGRRITPVVSSSGMTTDEVLQMRVGISKWVVHGLIPTGLTLLCGRPKVGKSLLSLYLGLGLSCGHKTIDTKLTKHRVLILAMEDNWKRLRSRLTKTIKALGIMRDEKSITYHIEWPKINEGGLPLIKQWADEEPGPALVIIDCLARFRSETSKPGYFFDLDYQAVKSIHDLCQKDENLSILLIHHTKKAKREEVEDIFDLISGTTGIYAAADTALILVKEARKDKTFNRVLALRGRDTDDEEYALSFNGNDFSWSLLGQREDHDLTVPKQEVVDLFGEHGKPMKISEIAKLTGKKLKPARVFLDRMVREGIILKTGKGEYYKR